MTSTQDIEKAKKVLRDAGYFVDNLWSIYDVNSNFICTPQQAYEVLQEVLHNSYFIQSVNEEISDKCEELGYKEKQG